MKKLSLFLAAAIATSMLTAVPASALDNIPPYTTKYTLGDTITFDDIEATNHKTVSVVEDDHDGGKKALELAQVGANVGGNDTRIRASYLVDWSDTPVNTGVLSVQFDLKYPQNAGGGSDEFRGLDDTKIIRFSNNGLGAYTNEDKAQNVLVSKMIKNMTWTKIELEFNFNKKEITGYVDGEKSDTATFPNGLKELKGFKFWKNGTYDNWYIDNFKAEIKIDPEAYESSYTIGETLDFEKSNVIHTSAELVEDGVKGKVLAITPGEGREKMCWLANFNEAAKSGKYVMSFDFKTKGDTKGWYNQIKAMPEEKGILQIDPGKENLMAANGKENFFGSNVKVSDWNRYAVVLDFDEGIMQSYMDGKLIAENELAAEQIEGLSFENYTNGVVWYIDNFKFEKLSDKDFSAELKASGNELRIDFSEPAIDFDEKKVTVKAATNSLDTNGSELGFEITYNDGNKAVLALDNAIEDGKRYIVKLDGVSSLTGKNLGSSSLTYTKGEMIDVAFAGSEGETSVDDISSTTDEIKVTFPKGLENNTLGGTISLTDKNGAPADYTGSYSAQNKEYTLSLNKLLGAENEYTLNISGVKDANGNEYAPVSGSFKTGVGVYALENLGVTKTAADATVSIDWVNTKENKTYVIILVGYVGNEMKSINYQTLTADKDSKEQGKTYTFTDASMGTYDKVAAYVWDSFEDITPILKGVTAL